MTDNGTTPTINTIEHIPEHIESEHIPKRHINKKQYVKKDGTIKNYEYEQNKYTTLYYMNNIDKFKQSHICQCGGVYIISNKSNHNKSKLHKLYLQYTNNNTTNIIEPPQLPMPQ